MRSALISGRAAISWRKCELISFRLPSFINQCRSLSQTLPASQNGVSLGAQPPAAHDNIIQDAFAAENVELFQKNRNRLARRDADAQYKTKMLGPLSASDIDVQRRLRRYNTRAVDILRQSIKDSTISPHVISLCLESHQQRVAMLPRKARHELLAEQREEGLARLVLSALWNDEKLWTSLVVGDESALFRICYYAILESLEEYVISWAFIAIAEAGSPLAGPGKHNAWRGKLLGKLITAHAALDSTNCADNMLLCMQRIIKEHEAVDASQAALVSLQQPSACCHSHLCTTVGGTTNVQLFDSFLQWLREHSSHYPLRRRFDEAHLLLHHPQAPTEAPALAILTVWDIRTSPDHPKQTEYHNLFLQRIIDVAAMNGNTQGAEWVKAKFRDRLDPTTGRFTPPTRRDLASRRLEARKNADVRRDRQPQEGRDRPLIRYT